MFYRTKTNSKGVTRYEVVDKYKDPLTGKGKTAVVSYHKNTSRARKQPVDKNFRRVKDELARNLVSISKTSDSKKRGFCDRTSL